MQAIVTKYLGPTNARSSRVKATCQAGSMTIEWDPSLNSDRNQIAAAKKLATKFGWDGLWLMGYLPNGNGVFVLDDDIKRNSFFVEANGTTDA